LTDSGAGEWAEREAVADAPLTERIDIGTSSPCSEQRLLFIYSKL
jgi:hypothetical protein